MLLARKYGGSMKRYSAAQPTELLTLNREVRARNDAETWLAEVLDGNMRTPFEFTFDGRELYAADGGACRPIFENALKDAQTFARTNPNLSFEVRRRQKELEEYYDMLAMARGELPNTMVVVSDFPPELMDATEDVGGYNVQRKQTMLRVLTWRDGKMTMVSQSLDQSDRRALEAIYRHLGVECEAGELLGQRIYLDAASERQEFLVDELMGVYDRSLQESRGGVWYGGRRAVRPQNTYDFVCQQADLVTVLADEFLKGSYDSEIVYAVAAAVRKRYIGQTAIPVLHDTVYFDPYVAKQLLRQEIVEAAAEAKSEGIRFSGCGVSVGASLNTEGQLSTNGYGNRTNSETNYSFNKKTYCRVCQAPPKKGENKKMCGPCGICKTCDAKLKASN